RKRDTIDIYFFGYGREYLECLKDFFHLCGSTPMVPRYSLGNWWSRFHRYTEEEYRLLVEKFEDENIPISVAILDMDWHLTEVDPKYGSGWTGYTWNNDFFPDPEHFMKWIHSKGMHISLNVHPADGVRPHEQMYLEMAKELNIDYLKEETIQFDITSPDFMQAYFKYLHHHNEDMGVDFWWVDWQQGASSKIEGLDPLWMLNHYHYLDCKRRGNQLMILSRYAGIGSHRYPIGFSGDTIATWDSLDFQPYFTANASNVGYCWWSHDIGGHMHGVKNDEMLTRWMQFGVFSPIMRIHSSDSPFFEKEPWNHNLNLQSVMKNFLRLRHQLVPYLYTMNWKLFAQSEPLLQPMYYRNTEDREAYEVPNEYYFGSEMIVCPITKPMNQVINLACFKAWLPKGIFFDLFNGRVYRGDRKIDLYRDITSIPVLAKAGSIIPMTGEEKLSNSLDNPEHLEIRVYAGADGEFELYEDNSENATEDEIQEVITLIQFIWSNKAEIHISSSENKYDVIPEKRDYTLLLIGFSDTEEFSVSGSEQYQKSYAADTHTLKILLKNVSLEEDITVCVNTNNCSIPENCILEQCLYVLKKTQISYDVLDMIHNIIKKEVGALQMLGELQTLNLEADLLGALTEIITAY
ncbi:MAG: TIM-barrel domain-containing protein, partial [Mobilitalea sp.]